MGALDAALFRPVGEAGGTLRVGDRLRVRLVGAPVATTIVITACDRPREIGWRGGVRALLGAEKSFHFEPDGAGGTRVRAVEKWFGLLTPITWPIVKRLAEKIAREQLAGLAEAVAR